MWTEIIKNPTAQNKYVKIRDPATENQKNTRSAKNFV